MGGWRGEEGGGEEKVGEREWEVGLIGCIEGWVEMVYSTVGGWVGGWAGVG